MEIINVFFLTLQNIWICENFTCKIVDKIRCKEKNNKKTLFQKTFWKFLRKMKVNINKIFTCKDAKSIIIWIEKRISETSKKVLRTINCINLYKAMQFINDSKTYYIIIIYKGGGNYGNYLNNSFISSDNVRTFILVLSIWK